METMIVTKLIALFLLLVFLGLNAMIAIARLTMGLGSSLWRRIFRIEIPENEKKGYEIVYTIIWIGVGLWAFWKLKNASLFGAVLGFLTFRSGANLSKTLVYTIHDQRIVREYSNEGRLLSIIGNASTLSLLIEVLFVVTLGVAYKTLSATLKSGMSAGNFLLYLWAAGFLFGLLFGWFMGRNNRGILLSNAFPIVVFFSARAGKKKAESGLKKTKDAARKPLERFKR